MQKKRKRDPFRVEVAIERNGERHVGYYYVEREMITVSYSKGGSKSTQVGGSPPEVLAKMLLSELVSEGHRT